MNDLLIRYRHYNLWTTFFYKIIRYDKYVICSANNLLQLFESTDAVELDQLSESFPQLKTCVQTQKMMQERKVFDRQLV